MDSSTIRAIHKYGAILSALGTAIAVLAFVVGGPAIVLGLFLGWAGPLGGFYFTGGYLAHTSTHRVVGEELVRGVAWYVGSLVAWSVIVTETTALSATPVTVFGLPALAALGIVLFVIGTRYVTGRDPKVETEGGQLLVTITGTIAFGFVALYLVVSGTVGWWLFGLYLVGVPVGLAVWWPMQRRFPDAFGVN